MTISYNWLSNYLSEKIEPQRLSEILTSIGLEVESLRQYESIKGGLKGLVIGEVAECWQHPNAEKLKVTKVNVGRGDLLQIVCGAPNVAAFQKVVVAPVGAIIYPWQGEPVTMKVAKIRGIDSYGMICAEDEIGIGESHEGIIILQNDAVTGTNASEYFNLYQDLVFEIGLTPNRMDAMSHLGVAKDLNAYLTHHHHKKYELKSPFNNAFKVDNNDLPVKVTIENTEACQRYAGVTIKGITVKESPRWLINKLKAIGQRPVNNIVDITNFILHETGQPLHAFDADEIKEGEIVVKNLPEGTIFQTLDGKNRKLTATDIMICNKEEGMCIAGVFGGITTGVKETTKNIFLESAWFNPIDVRKTSLYHELRTDAAIHFEKGVDISNSVNVLKRAALLVKEIAGGVIAGEITDIYPKVREREQVKLKYQYLKKLSGKIYSPDTVIKILESLGFKILKEEMDELSVAAPFSKPDIHLPADIVEEIIRIDGLNNIEIPSNISITPAIETLRFKEKLKEKISNSLVGLGFNEILTNSITNSSYYVEEIMIGAVKLINNLSADLNILRPSLLENILETIAYNINHRNNNLSLFEFGKSYSINPGGGYLEEEHLSLCLTGNHFDNAWKEKARPTSFFMAKGILSAVLKICGVNDTELDAPVADLKGLHYNIKGGNNSLGSLSIVTEDYLKTFGIKQSIYFIDLKFSVILELVNAKSLVFQEIPRVPTVQRDLAVIIDKSIVLSEIKTVLEKLNLKRLQEIRLFDVFESDRLGEGKKSYAINLAFIDKEKTLTDKEVEDMMEIIIHTLTNNLRAEIRK